MSAPAAPLERDAILDAAPGDGVVASGARWLAVGQVLLQIVKLAVSVVLARLIAPDEFGLLALALVVSDFLERVLGDTGTSSALIQRRALSQQLVSSVFYFNLLIGVVTCGVLAGSAPLLASVLGDGRAAPVLRGLGFTFVLLSLGLVQRAVLRRSLSFAALAKADVVNAIVQGVVSIVLAVQGAGVWALVVGLLAGKAASNVALWVASPWRPSWHFRWGDIREISRFSGNLSAFQFFSYFHEAGDKFIVGRFVSTTALGYYGFGYRLLLNPVKAVLSVSRGVLFPAFSRMQDRDAEIRRGYLRATAVVALVVFPAAVAVTVLAEPLVAVVLGRRWLPAVPVIRIFGPIAMLQSVTLTTGALFQSKGRTDLQLRTGVLHGLGMLVAYLIGSRWGEVGVAWGFLAGVVLITCPLLVVAFRLVELRLSTFVSNLAPYAAAGAAMALATLGCQALLESRSFDGAAVLVAAAAIGGAVYLGTLLILRAPALKDAILLVKPTR